MFVTSGVLFREGRVGSGSHQGGGARSDNCVAAKRKNGWPEAFKSKFALQRLRKSNRFSRELRPVPGLVTIGCSGFYSFFITKAA